MKKLEVVFKTQDVTGNVIEFTDSFLLRKYGENEYGVYDVETVKKLTEEEISDVTRQPNLAKRIKRLHHYLREAEFISDLVIDCLNYNREDSFEALKAIVD